MVPGIGLHQNGHLLFEAYINQICGWEIRAQDGQSFVQYEKNAKALEKQNVRISYATVFCQLITQC